LATESNLFDVMAPALSTLKVGNMFSLEEMKAKSTFDCLILYFEKHYHFFYRVTIKSTAATDAQYSTRSDKGMLQ